MPPLTAAYCFVASSREARAREGSSALSLVEGIGMWKALLAEEKKEWEERAAAAREVYLRECVEKEQAKKDAGAGAGDGEGEGEGEGEEDEDEEVPKKGAGGRIPEADEEWLAVQLPMARVSRILRYNKDVAKISRDACFLVTKSTEAFLERRVSDAARLTARQNRKTIMLKDLLTSLEQSDNVDALQYFIDEFQPPAEPSAQPKKRSAKRPSAHSKKGRAAADKPVKEEGKAETAVGQDATAEAADKPSKAARKS